MQANTLRTVMNDVLLSRGLMALLVSTQEDWLSLTHLGWF